MGAMKNKTAKKSAAKKVTKTAAKNGRSKNQSRDIPALASLFIPKEESHRAAAYYETTRPLLLTEQAVLEFIKSDQERGLAVMKLQDKLAASRTLFEADLVNLVANRAVRQLVLTRVDSGWQVQALPLWNQDFLTLVSLKKEKRHYLDLDRLISSITKHGPLPPTILIGK